MTLRAMLLGAAPDTSNLGVGALVASAVAAVKGVDSGAEISVLDNGYGRRGTSLEVGDNRYDITAFGARGSKRITSRDSLYRIYLEGLLGRRADGLLDEIRRCDVALDASGGDSFSDIYGRERFIQILLHKRLVIGQRRPLVLLPQTIGPFSNRGARRMAVAVLRRADIVIARDQWSYDQLRSLLGSRFDDERHWIGPDLAFALPTADPQLDADTREFLARPHPTAGINISGLLYLDEHSSRRFGFADDYRVVVRRVIESLLRDTDAQVLLVSHVVAPPGRPESDIEAHRLLARSFGDESRIHIAPPPSTPSEAKGLIAQTDWFAGSRMHSTIAALSSGVPSASLAYSDKARGVFATVGSEDDVADLRRLGAGPAAGLMTKSFNQRESARKRLGERLPSVRARARQQVVDAIERARRPSGSAK